LFYCKNQVGQPPFIAKLEPCLAKMIALKWVSALKMGMGYFGK
jgi:hypothetical protein